VFQSRAGFSECLDALLYLELIGTFTSFNPVLGFLSVSTFDVGRLDAVLVLFQSRAGFSECLDL